MNQIEKMIAEKKAKYESLETASQLSLVEILGDMKETIRMLEAHYLEKRINQKRKGLGE